jgi:hypothetical protein
MTMLRYGRQAVLQRVVKPIRVNFSGRVKGALDPSDWNIPSQEQVLSMLG